MSLPYAEITHLRCGQCGIEFYVPTFWYEARKARGEGNKTFHCPNGHARVFIESDLEKVRRERDRLAQQIAEKDDEIKRAREGWNKSAKRAAKLEKRASAGVCPCCTRTFSNMARHMKTKHPEFAPDNVVPLKTA